jgi:hypothetical protein
MCANVHAATLLAMRCGRSRHDAPNVHTLRPSADGTACSATTICSSSTSFADRDGFPPVFMSYNSPPVSSEPANSVSRPSHGELANFFTPESYSSHCANDPCPKMNLRMMNGKQHLA